MANILCAGRYSSLTRTRRIMLESMGHSVWVAADEEELKATCRKQSLDLAVLEETIPDEMKCEWTRFVRALVPFAGVLELYWPQSQPAVPNADACYALVHPGQFMAAVDSVTRRIGRIQVISQTRVRPINANMGSRTRPSGRGSAPPKKAGTR